LITSQLRPVPNQQNSDHLSLFVSAGLSGTGVHYDKGGTGIVYSVMATLSDLTADRVRYAQWS